MEKKIQVDARQALAQFDAVQTRLTGLYNTLNMIESETSSARSSFAGNARQMADYYELAQNKMSELVQMTKQLSREQGNLTKINNALARSSDNDIIRLNATTINSGVGALISPQAFDDAKAAKDVLLETKEVSKQLYGELDNVSNVMSRSFKDITVPLDAFIAKIDTLASSYRSLRDNTGSLREIIQGIEKAKTPTEANDEIKSMAAELQKIAGKEPLTDAQVEKQFFGENTAALNNIADQVNYVNAEARQAAASLEEAFGTNLIQKLVGFGNNVDSITFKKLYDQLNGVVNLMEQLPNGRKIVTGIFEGEVDGKKYDPTQSFDDPDSIDLQAQAEAFKRGLEAVRQQQAVSKQILDDDEKRLLIAKDMASIAQRLVQGDDFAFDMKVFEQVNALKTKLMRDPSQDTSGYIEILDRVLAGETSITEEQSDQMQLLKGIIALDKQRANRAEYGFETASEATDRNIEKKKEEVKLAKRTEEVNRAIAMITARTGDLRSGMIEDQLQYHNALDAVRQAMLKTDLTAEQLDETYDQLSKNTLKLTADNLKLVPALLGIQKAAKSNSVALQKMSIDMGTIMRFTEFRALSTIFYSLTGFIRQAYDRAIEFGTAVSEIQTISKDIPLSFEAWARGLERVSSKFNIDLIDTATAAYQALSNQIAEGPALLGFMDVAAEFSKATVSKLSNSVDTLTGILNAYGLSAGSAQRISDELFNTIDLGRITADQLANTIGRVAVTSGQLGLATAEMEAALAVITRMGISTPEALTQLKNLLQKLIDPSEKLKEVYADWGVNNGPQAIASFGFQGVLERLAIEGDKGIEVLEELFQRIRAFQPALTLTSAKDQFISDFNTISESIGDSAEAAEVVLESMAQVVDRQVTTFKNIMARNVGEVIDFFGAYVKSVEEAQAATGNRPTFLGLPKPDLPLIAEFITKIAIISALAFGTQRALYGLVEGFSAIKQVLGGLKVSYGVFKESVAGSMAEIGRSASVAENMALPWVQKLGPVSKVAAVGVTGLGKAFLFVKGAAAAAYVATGPLITVLALIGAAYGILTSAVSGYSEAKLASLKLKLDNDSDQSLKERTQQLNAQLKAQLALNKATSQGISFTLTEANSKLKKETDGLANTYDNLTSAMKTSLETALSDIDKAVDRQIEAVSGGLERYLDHMEKQLNRDVSGNRIRGKRRQANAYEEVAQDYLAEAEAAQGMADFERANTFYERAEKMFDQAQSLNKKLNFEQEFDYIYQQREAIALRGVSAEKAQLILIGRNIDLTKDQLKLNDEEYLQAQLQAKAIGELLDAPKKVIDEGGTKAQLNDAFDAVQDWIEENDLQNGIVPFLKDGQVVSAELGKYLDDYRTKLIGLLDMNEQLNASIALRAEEEKLNESITSTMIETQQLGIAQGKAYFEAATGTNLNIKDQAALFAAQTGWDFTGIEYRKILGQWQAAYGYSDEERLGASAERKRRKQDAETIGSIIDPTTAAERRNKIAKAYEDPTLDSLAIADAEVEDYKKKLDGLNEIGPDGLSRGASIIGANKYIQLETEGREFIRNYEAARIGQVEDLKKFGEDKIRKERLDKLYKSIGEEKIRQYEASAIGNTAGKGALDPFEILYANGQKLVGLDPIDPEKSSFPGATELTEYFRNNAIFEKNKYAQGKTDDGITIQEANVIGSAKALFQAQNALAESSDANRLDATKAVNESAALLYAAALDFRSDAAERNVDLSPTALLSIGNLLKGTPSASTYNQTFNIAVSAAPGQSANNLAKDLANQWNTEAAATNILGAGAI